MIVSKKVLYSNFNKLCDRDLDLVIEVANMLKEDRKKDMEGFSFTENADGNGGTMTFGTLIERKFDDIPTLKDYKIGDIVGINSSINLRKKNEHHHFCEFVVVKITNQKIKIKLKTEPGDIEPNWVYSFDPEDIHKI